MTYIFTHLQFPVTKSPHWTAACFDAQHVIQCHSNDTQVIYDYSWEFVLLAELELCTSCLMLDIKKLKGKEKIKWKEKERLKFFISLFATPKCSTLLFCWRIKSKGWKPEPEITSHLELVVIRNILTPVIISI